ncbi:MAG: prolyl oligopeptidase family serine peptidase [Candidatus Zixiibacteriota bacterium]
MKKDYKLKMSDGENLSVTTYGEPDSKNNCVIYIHGFKGFKDWGFVPYIGQFLSQKGFLAVTFNFSHNGIGDNMTEFTELDKFANNTFSREIRELNELVAACKSGEFGPCDKVGILGHSRGGGTSLLAGSQNKDIGAVATWSAVSSFNRYSEALKSRWREKGFFEVVNQRTRQVMRLNTVLLDDIEANGENSLNIEKAIKNLGKPLLIVHGEEDEAVPEKEADIIYNWADANQSEIIKIPGAGHTFGAAHPFQGSNEKLDQVLTASANFFEKYL